MLTNQVKLLSCMKSGERGFKKGMEYPLICSSGRRVKKGVIFFKDFVFIIKINHNFSFSIFCFWVVLLKK